MNSLRKFYIRYSELLLSRMCNLYLLRIIYFIRFALELRHILGMIIDDDGEILELKKELDIFKKVLDIVNKEYPLFRIKLIICGLKIVGREQIEQQINFIH